MSNPYLASWRRRRQHKRADEGLLRSALWLLPLLAVPLAAPLLRDSMMWFLGHPDFLADGVVGLGVRLGMVLCGAMALFTFSALVRGPERAILDPHPARPQQLLNYLLLRTAVERSPLLLAVGLFLWPVALEGGVLAWGLTWALAAGGWAVGLLAGFPVHLGSVWAAEAPALTGLMDLIRGQNPRMQAALIYAPGVVLGLGAAGVGLGAGAVAPVLAGELLPALYLLTPLALGALAWLAVPVLAQRYHFRATLLLAEVDAAYGSQEDPEEARRVYLEWVVRHVPADLRVTLLKELRHGWRGLRTWVTGAWGLGLLAAASAWSDDPEDLTRTLVLIGAGQVLVGVVGLRLALTDPRWLELSLPQPLGPRLAARALAVFLWLQGLIWLAGAAAFVRQGMGAALWLLAWSQALALLVALLSAATSQLRARGVAPYLSVALLLWVAVIGASA